MKVFWGFLTLDMPSRAAFTMFSMREKYQRMEGVSFSIFAVFSHGRIWRKLSEVLIIFFSIYFSQALQAIAFNQDNDILA